MSCAKLDMSVEMPIIRTHNNQIYYRGNCLKNLELLCRTIYFILCSSTVYYVYTNYRLIVVLV